MIEKERAFKSVNYLAEEMSKSPNWIKKKCKYLTIYKIFYYLFNLKENAEKVQNHISKCRECASFIKGYRKNY